MKIKACVILIALLFASSTSASGDIIATVQNGDWDDPATWSSSRAPTREDEAIVRHRVVTSTDAATTDAGKLTIEPAGTLELDHRATTATVLRIFGDLKNDGVIRSTDESLLGGFRMVKDSSISGSGTYERIGLSMLGDVTVTVRSNLTIREIAAFGRLVLDAEKTLTIEGRGELTIPLGGQVVLSAGTTVQMSGRSAIAIDTDPFNPEDRGGRLTARGTKSDPVLITNSGGGKYSILIDGEWDVEHICIENWEADQFKFEKNATVIRMRNASVGPADPGNMLVFEGITAKLEKIYFDDELDDACNIVVRDGADVTVEDYGGPAAGPQFSCEEDGEVTWQGDTHFVGPCERDCNSNSTDDEFDATEGASNDLNTNLIPDECEIATVGCSFRGTAEGGTISLTVEGFADTCTVTVDTLTGQTAEEIVSILAATVNADLCLSSQDINATATRSVLSLTGLALHLSDLSVTVTDVGLSQETPVVKVPGLGVPGQLALIALLLLLALGYLRRLH